MSEYLVRAVGGKWEICHASVFTKYEDGEKTQVCAWADRSGALHCFNEDVDSVRELED